MNKQEYLNQISATSRPVGTAKGGKFGKILSSKITMIVVGAIALFIVIGVIGAIIGGAKGNVKDSLFSLKVHADNTKNVIDDYLGKVKSSALRSDGSTLSSLLADLNGNIEGYVTEKYNMKVNEIEKKLNEKKIEQLQLEKDDLEASLFEAKINGNLDRVYAHKMAYEISLIMAEENQIAGASNDDSLKGFLSNNYTSLENLYHKVDSFSEAQ